MTMSQIFSSSFLLVFPFWILMIFLPRWRRSEQIIRSAWIAAPAALLYVVLVAPKFLAIFSSVLNPSLEPIAATLGTLEGATIAWVHFLAFDLFTARWAYLDSLERKLSPWVVSPILFFILMLGPLGLLLYLVARSFKQVDAT